MNSLRQPSRPRGQTILLALIFFGIFLGLSTALISYVTVNAKNERVIVAGSQALALAEGGIDQSAYQLNQNPNYTGETLPLGAGTVTTSVTSIDNNDKRITAIAYIPNSTNPTSIKEVRATLSINSNVVSFRYGVQAGAGGFVLSGGATVNGSIYANGSISATTGVHITGSAVAADPAALSADQVNDVPVSISSCTTSTCITFATTTNTQDFAQSFKISTAQPLNSVQFYMKKVGAPSDATVRIVNDSSGSPSTDVLMTGTLSASTVTTNFGWVTVTLPSTPVLDPSQTYWMVIDASANSSKYYVIGANANGYANGTAMIGKYGGSWLPTAPAGLDGYFQLYLGGGTSMIGGNNYVTGVYVGTTPSDEAWANNVMGATVTGPLYCQTSSYTSKACVTSNSDPSPQAMPLSDSNIQDWKDEAVAGGVTSGNVTVGSSGASIGPQEIVGNLTVNGGGTLTVTGNLWVTGNVTVSNGGKVQLSSIYGANDGAIVSDGYVTVSGGASFSGSGTAGSYPFLVTTSACPAGPGCNGNNAMSLSGGAGAVALVAQNGTVEIDGGSELKAVTAKQITMTNGASLTYDSGLINSNFTSGPGGSWAFVPGSYAIVR